MPRRFQFSLKTVLLLTVVASVAALLASWMLHFRASMARAYGEWQRASAEARLQGKSLGFQEWQRSYERKLRSEAEQK